MNTVRCATITANDYPLSINVRTHEVRSDLSLGSGGADTSPGAHDFFDMSLAICKAHTAMWFAKRKNIPLERVEAVVESDSTQERQGIYKMKVRLAFHGTLTDDQRTQLERAAAACPVSKLMTTVEVQIESTVDDVAQPAT